MRSVEDILTFSKFERINFDGNSNNKKILKRAIELEFVVETFIGKRRYFEVIEEQELLLLYPEMMIDEKTKKKYQDLIDGVDSPKIRHEKLQKILSSNLWNKNLKLN
jgi:hypothetical protein